MGRRLAPVHLDEMKIVIVASAAKAVGATMVDVRFTLYRADGVQLDDHQTRGITQVPRMGEFVSPRPSDPYLIVDVLWHLPAGGEPFVTATAFELSWQVDLREIEAEWRAHGWSKGAE